MRIPKVLQMSALLLAIQGCSSSHNLQEDDFNSLGGGYSVTALHEDLYFIEAKTNFAPWKNFAGAQEMWNVQASEACEGRS